MDVWQIQSIFSAFKQTDVNSFNVIEMTQSVCVCVCVFWSGNTNWNVNQNIEIEQKI